MDREIQGVQCVGYISGAPSDPPDFTFLASFGSTCNLAPQLTALSWPPVSYGPLRLTKCSAFRFLLLPPESGKKSTKGTGPRLPKNSQRARMMPPGNMQEFTPRGASFDPCEIRDGREWISSLSFLPSTDCSKRQFLCKTCLQTSTWLSNPPAKQVAMSFLQASQGRSQLSNHHLTLLVALLPLFLILPTLGLYITIKLLAHNPYPRLCFLEYFGGLNNGP